MIVLYILSVGTVLIMLLNGWKEIASYLKTSVRTVQRWERCGLPVVRPGDGLRGSVVAHSEQVDQWLLRRTIRRNKSHSNGVAKEDVQFRKNLQRAHLLSLQLREAQERIRLQLQDLCSSLLKTRSNSTQFDAPSPPSHFLYLTRDADPN